MHARVDTVFEKILIDASDWKVTAAMRGGGRICVTRKSDGRQFPVTSAEKAHYLAALQEIRRFGVPELLGRGAAILMLRKLCEAVAQRDEKWYSLFFNSEPAAMAQWFIKEAGETIDALSTKSP